MLTYFFNEIHDFRYGKLFNNILKYNKNWKLDNISDVVILSDKNSKSMIQLYIDGENNFILKHKLAEYYNLLDYIPMTFVIKNSIVLENINKLFDKNYDNILYLKPSDGRIGAGKDIILLDKKLAKKKYIEQITKKHKNWVVQKEIINPLLFQNKKFAIRFFIVVIHNKKKICLYSGKICKINVCENQYIKGSIDPKVHISHNENETKDDNQIKYGTINGIYNINDDRFDFDGMKILMKKMEFISFDLIIKNSNNFYSNNNSGYRIYGVDFTINNKFNPFLLEINDNPVLLFGSEKLIKKISIPLLTDVIYLIENMFDGVLRENFVSGKARKNKLKFLNFITSFYIKKNHEI